MWLICSSNSVHRLIFQLRQPKGHKVKFCQSHLEKLLYHRHSEFKYQSVFTSPKTCLLHPQHSKDKIPQDHALIYKNRLMRIIGPARVITTVAGLATVALSCGNALNFPVNQESLNVYALSGICLFTLVMTVFVNVMFRFYLLRIYFNKDSNKFIGVYKSFFGNVKHIEYSVADLQAAKRSVTDSIHIKCNIHIGGRSFHLRGEDFIVPKYYNMHLGLL